MMKLKHLLTIFVICVASYNFSKSADANEPAGQAIFCKPYFEYYCANIHVACAGRSALAAPSLRVKISRSRANVETSSSETLIGSLKEGRDRLITFEQGQGYLRIETNGRYSLRRYIGGKALMSLGTCTS